MKKTALTFVLILSACIYLMAQAPQSFNYQAIARDVAGNILAGKQISVRISLLQASPEGEALYSESHNALTNSFGLFTLKIGRGNTLKGNFASLKWHENSHYIQIELDAEGGEDYQMMGTAELLSVPYALYAEHSGDGSRSNDYDWGSYYNHLFTGTGGNYPSGNVGIGITTPQAKLHVEGDILSQEIRSVSTDQTSTERVVNNKIITTYAPQTQASVNASSFQIKAATEDATHSIGNTNQINGMKFSFIHRNNGSLNDFYGIRSQGGMPNGSWGGAGSSGSINKLTGLRSELYGEKGSVTFANNISLIKVGDNFSNYSYLQIGNSGDINGNYGIYNAAAYPNYFAGNTGLGTSNPQAMLHVNGNVRADTITGIAFSSNSPLLLQTNYTTRIYVDDNEGKVGIGTTAPNASAALDVSSTTKGFLPPRMTSLERDNIPNPEAGLMIFNIDSSCINFYNGNKWRNLGLDSNLVCGYTFTDPRDGQRYPTVQIGDQCWMARNLRARVYPNGDSIPYITENSEWGALGVNNTADACCYYNNEPNSEYGVLYTYAAAIGDNWLRDNFDGQGICPDGWHMPTDAEWKILEGTADTQYPVGDSEWDNDESRGYDAGTHLKFTSGWNSGGNGDNNSGFAALPGGCRYYGYAFFINAGYFGHWWSATEYNSLEAWFRALANNSVFVYRDGSYKSCGFSVRCLRDD